MARLSWLILFVLALLPIAAVAPGVPTFVAERQLVAALESALQNDDWSGASDLDLRRAVQRLAREHGFHLSTHDVIVSHIHRSGSGVEVTGPERVGYTLTLRLPVFWLFDFELVAVRSVTINSRNAS